MKIFKQFNKDKDTHIVFYYYFILLSFNQEDTIKIKNLFFKRDQAKIPVQYFKSVFPG